MALKASFLGLGSMGSPMAFNLLKHDVDLAVYNRSKDKAEPLVDAGAKLLDHPSDAFKHAPIVFSMVANDQALEAITEGDEGLLQNASPGCIHVSCSTVAPETTHKLMIGHEKKKVNLIAAPVFGRPEVAARQELWIAMAGNDAARKRVEPLLNMLGRKVYDFGDKPEAANCVKLAGNFMVLSAFEMMGEAFAFAQANGIKPEQLHAFLTETLFPSPVFINFGKLILQEKFLPAGLTIALGLKDINLFLNTAKSSKLDTPLAQVIQNQLNISVDKGREEFDWSAISLLAQENTGEPVSTKKDI